MSSALRRATPSAWYDRRPLKESENNSAPAVCIRGLLPFCSTVPSSAHLIVDEVTYWICEAWWHKPSPACLGVGMDSVMSSRSTLEAPEHYASLFLRNDVNCFIAPQITIEDIIEELIGTEIVDETDTHVDNERKERVNPKTLVRQTL